LLDHPALAEAGGNAEGSGTVFVVDDVDVRAVREQQFRLGELLLGGHVVEQRIHPLFSSSASELEATLRLANECRTCARSHAW
jgi:hypothetical protein